MSTLIVALIIALATAAFALQNTGAVTIRLFLWEYQTSLVLVIFGSAGTGMVLAFIACLGHQWRRTRNALSMQSLVETQGTRIRELEEALRLSSKNSPPPA
jgi:uncharacterized integral membrane protein